MSEHWVPEKREVKRSDVEVAYGLPEGTLLRVADPADTVIRYDVFVGGWPVASVYEAEYDPIMGALEIQETAFDVPCPAWEESCRKVLEFAKRQADAKGAG